MFIVGGNWPSVTLLVPSDFSRLVLRLWDLATGLSFVPLLERGCSTRERCYPYSDGSDFQCLGVGTLKMEK